MKVGGNEADSQTLNPSVKRGRVSSPIGSGETRCTALEDHQSNEGLPAPRTHVRTTGIVGSLSSAASPYFLRFIAALRDCRVP